MERFLSNRKRSAKVVLIALILVLLPVAILQIVRGYKYIGTYILDLSAILEKLEAYETVANVCLNYVEENPSKDGLIWFVTSNDKMTTYIWKDSSVSDTIKIPLTKDEEEALKTVNTSFSIKRKLDAIMVKEGYVSFCAYQEPASIIYSFNDTKPNFIRYSGEEVEYSILFNVVKIVDHWYFACN